MKSYSGIMEKATEYSNMYESMKYVLRGTKRKTCRTGRYLLANFDKVIAELQDELRSGTFRISHYHQFNITECGKERTIQAIPLRDRVALNALMSEIERRVTPELIADTASSIKGRGGLYLHKRVVEAIKREPNMRWFYKCDIRKYYQSIDQELIIDIIRRKFREHSVQEVLTDCARMLERGLSIGLRSSQLFGNILLSIYVDHPVKEGMGVRNYWRYCDDILVGATSRSELTPIIQAIHKFTAQAKLEIKPNEQVFCIDDRPIDFLGYIIHGDGHVSIRKHIKKRFARRWRKVKSKNRKEALLGSFYGMAKHAQCRHLFKQITGINMKDFAELGVSYVAQDGKKRYECATVKLDDIQNVSVVVKDFETGITTREGSDRYVVLVEDDNGNEKKFFTASEEMKQLLTKIKDMGELPFRTIIRKKNFGEGKKKYCFT